MPPGYGYLGQDNPQCPVSAGLITKALSVDWVGDGWRELEH